MNRLIIFIKNPEKGKVKTRLAAGVGDERALEIYMKLLEHTRMITQEFKGERLLYYSEQIQLDDEWNPHFFKKEVQSGLDLGQRMGQAFQASFSNHVGKVCIIGSDCYQLRSDHLEEAFRLLEQSDLVIGPSKDGGYYLLGMKEYHPELFQNVQWSTPEVFDQSIGIASKLGLSVGLLPELSDVDTIDDLPTMGITE